MRSDFLRLLISTVLMLMICAPGLLAHDEVKSEKISITQQEFEIYKQLGIANYENPTSNHSFYDWAKEQIPNISAEVIADYVEKNSQSYRLRWVLKDGKLKKLPKFPYGSTVEGYSRIGFNKEATEALVYTTWSAPGNMCESDFYHLKKEGNEWQVLKKVMVVIC